jgi:hypothetical protein
MPSNRRLSRTKPETIRLDPIGTLGKRPGQRKIENGYGLAIATPTAHRDDLICTVHVDLLDSHGNTENSGLERNLQMAHDHHQPAHQLFRFAIGIDSRRLNHLLEPAFTDPGPRLCRFLSRDLSYSHSRSMPRDARLNKRVLLELIIARQVDCATARFLSQLRHGKLVNCI